MRKGGRRLRIAEPVRLLVVPAYNMHRYLKAIGPRVLATLRS